MTHLSALLYLILMVAIGYGASAAKLLSAQTTDALPQVLFNICYPAMILDTLLNVDTSVVLGTGLPVVAATILITLILFVLGLVVFHRQPEDRRALYIFLMAIGNVTYVAIPLFSVFLPAEAVLLALLHSTAQDPLIWGIYHPLLLGCGNGKQNSFVHTFTNPCLLATLAGIALCFCKFEPPVFLLDTVARISSATSPLALLLIGMLVHQYGLFSWLHDRRALLYSFLKVLILPCFVFLILCPFLNRSDAILLSILFGSPAPLLSVVWARQNNQDVAFPIHCFLASTLLFLAAASLAILTFLHFGIL